MTMMTIATMDFTQRWELDLLARHGRETQAEAPKHPLESGALAQNHVADQHDTLEASGTLTQSPASAAETPGSGRVNASLDALRALEGKHLPVWWMGPTFSGLALLTKVKDETTPADGFASKVDLSAVRYLTVTPQQTQMPASKVKAAVKPGTAAKSDGASQKGSSILGHLVRR
jgi:hypothetical protein